VFTTSGTYPWSFVTLIFHNSQPSLSGRSASYLDLHLEIDSDGRLRTKLYDKRDDFNFTIVNFPFICSNIPAVPSYGEYLSQLRGSFLLSERLCGRFLYSGPPREFVGPRAKGNLPPFSNAPNNDTRAKSTTVCYKQRISTIEMN
jgi:hypothetical protein